MMMNEIEVSIGGIVEARRVNTMKRINSEVEYVVQDNNDLEDMKLLYEILGVLVSINLLRTVTWKICSCCMRDCHYPDTTGIL